MRQLIDNNCEHRKEFLMVFIDYKKAFDSVKREEMWESLEKIGIAVDLLRKAKNTYKRTVNCIKTNKGQSAGFEARTGVRQGSILLLVLFNIVMNDVK
jgi:hypothetical protein